MDFQTIAAVVFLIALTIFVYLNRKSLDTKQIIPHILYFSMYKAKWGLSLMDSASNKYRRFMLYIGYLGVLAGFLGMIIISYGLVSNIYVLFTKPSAAPGVGLVLPFKAKGIFFVPFFYWIISIFVIAVVHEFSHGLIARANNLKVKSSGFAFLGLIVPIIPAAFVEPDEKELRKRSHKEQLSVFAAGPFANILTGLFFILILALIMSPILIKMIEPNGVKFGAYAKGEKIYPAEAVGIKVGETIQKIDIYPITTWDNLSTVLKDKKPNDTILVKTDKSTYKIKLEKNPDNESLAFMGISSPEQSIKIKDEANEKYGKFIPNLLLWLYGLFYWLYLLNLGIGLFNLVPIGPLDGGRMMQLVLHKIFEKEKGDKYWHFIGMFFLVLILVNVVAGFVR